ncbi:MAG: glycogen/starch/alpha-glucan phosphorylase [Oscillospiraceae bacterium]|nr:glycogen/starch/alpha-glucan phosphorylase [Oscillospiraceae bacterium]
MLGVPAADAEVHALHQAVGTAVLKEILPHWNACRKAHLENRRVCYFSMEFLMGRAVYNNLYCLGLLDDMEQAFKEAGASLSAFEEIEDAALGNGGLGRLAACFLDSAAALSLPVDGYGIRYRYGLFKQGFKDGRQTETGDDWQKFGDPWSVRNDSEAVDVVFRGQTVRAVPYDMPVIGYEENGRMPHIGTLRLWQAEPVEAFDFKAFNDQDYISASRETINAEDISRCLYPNDDTRAGKALRLKQQYFFCAASLADCIRKHKAQFGTLDSLPEYLAVQLNDTHPVISIPELIRLLEKEGYSFTESLAMAKQIFSYTNHTIMQEALEKWDCDLVEELLPEIYAIMLQISEQFLEELYAAGTAADQIQAMRIIKNGQVHMANLAMYAGSYVNGVAAIHTELLKTTVLKEWYALSPEKFQNKTNGITQRRWLGVCNPELTALFRELNGGSEHFLKELDDLKQLSDYANDAAVMEKFIAVKQLKKQQLADYIEKTEGVRIDPTTCFDIQIKRLHEYKRQLLNAFSILWIYFGLKDGSITDFTPTTFLFGAKSAPGYRRAKAIIKYINEIAELIDNDPDVKGLMQVHFVTNYNVSYAEKLVSACDISEQISTAGTEASGTGNMKMMLNGAVTLGTLDGANIEIVEAAGEENNYIFGATVEELEKLENYCSRAVMSKDPRIARVVKTLIDGTVSDGGTGEFRELYFALLDGASWHQPDHYYLLLDLPDYVETKLRAIQDYRNTGAFAAKQWRNACAAGKFSSDRTIRQYAEECWHIQPVSPASI